MKNSLPLEGCGAVFSRSVLTLFQVEGIMGEKG